MDTTATRREHFKRQMAVKSTDQMLMKANLAPPTITPDSPRPQKVLNTSDLAQKDANTKELPAMDTKGHCFGKSVKAETLKRTCPCSCDAIHFDRIQTCCKTVGQRGMAFCLPLCKYNTTVDEASYKCVSQLTTWAYCAADVSDNTACCKSRGVAMECLSFCKGDVPTCDLQNIFSYQPCLRHIETITYCHKESLVPEPRWNPEWTARCEWDESD
ncbi:unnamed protein product [Thelazia callipaeda]|uniref:DB domain-containing protein n=1 Tax=Thelazia callipaeda TaxID=103827 RepID=A0A0N5CY25_THECL|nr:unnamed protein product [Thelazia callipaeda]